MKSMRLFSEYQLLFPNRLKIEINMALVNSEVEVALHHCYLGLLLIGYAVRSLTR